MQAPSHQAQFARLASAFESHRKTANDTFKMVSAATVKRPTAGRAEG